MTARLDVGDDAGGSSKETLPDVGKFRVSHCRQHEADLARARFDQMVKCSVRDQHHYLDLDWTFNIHT